LDCGHAQLVAGCNFGIRIVADHQDLLREELVPLEYRPERVELALGPRFFDGISALIIMKTNLARLGPQPKTDRPSAEASVHYVPATSLAAL
jgi:hypothetical protein